MSEWAVILPAAQWATERLFHNESVTVAVPASAVAPDDEVLLVADDHVVALARAVKSDGDDLVLAYLRRSFDEPVPAEGLLPPGADQAGVDRGPADQAAADQASADRAGADRGGADRAGADQAGADRAGLVRADPAAFRRLSAAVTGDSRRGLPTWLVSVALPIEAGTPADAVRQFWSHVVELGPAELPTYVWPSGDELAMQAFVLGEEANQDPEEDDED